MTTQITHSGSNIIDKLAAHQLLCQLATALRAARLPSDVAVHSYLSLLHIARQANLFVSLRDLQVRPFHSPSVISIAANFSSWVLRDPRRQDVTLESLLAVHHFLHSPEIN